jgi:geranylgeranyl diphosphate synthase type II
MHGVHDEESKHPYAQHSVSGVGILRLRDRVASLDSHCSQDHKISAGAKITTHSLVILTVMLNQILEQGRALADAALERLLPPATQQPASIHRAMRHSVFAGGKRIRPILCMEACRMIANSVPAGIEDLSAALEMLHTYSLIHDDLPALDDDDLRRGRPTCHKVFGEAIAILAGDALQTLAYEVLARLHCPAEARVRIIEEIARGTGTIDGMIGGQVVDLEAERTKPDIKTLEYIHRAKTAALITASVVSGGIYAGADQHDVENLRSFGQSIGLAFQIVDDVLDVTQTSEQLGKTAGKDTVAEKATYPALFGIDESLKRADALVESGFTSLHNFGARAEILKSLARFLVERKK